ncbi:hypothetical protein ACQGFJ_01580 [Rhodococcus sp. 3.70]
MIDEIPTESGEGVQAAVESSADRLLPVELRGIRRVRRTHTGIGSVGAM